MNTENALVEIGENLDLKEEWLIVHATGKSFALQRSEIEITLERGKIILGLIDEKGFQLWRVRNYKIEKEVLTLDVTRNFQSETDKIKFVPRIASAELSAAVELARIEKANEIARLIISQNPKSKLIRVALNKENGRFAEIIFEQPSKKQIAASADVKTRRSHSLNGGARRDLGGGNGVVPKLSAFHGIHGQLSGCDRIRCDY